MFSNEKVIQLFSEKYKSLLLDKNDALVIFSLFLALKENIEKKSFSEQEVRFEISKYIGSTSDRDKKGIIEKNLQKLFGQNSIEKFEGARITLSSYSLQLCSLFYNSIYPLLNPSEIEKILEDVIITLENRIDTIENLKHWYDTQFCVVVKSKIEEQIIALDFQISKLENDFNNQFKILSTTELISYCNENIGRLIEDRIKLSKSFNGLDNITEILAECNHRNTGNIDFIIIRSQLNEEVEKARFRLESIGDKISHLKEIVRSLFDVIDKKPFIQRMESFLEYVLTNSVVVNKTNTRDSENEIFYTTEIELPNTINTISIINNAPNFKLPIFYENFIQSKNVVSEKREINKGVIEDAKIRRLLEKEKAKKIENWMLRLKQTLEKENEFNFAESYLEVLEDGDIDLAIKGTEYILKQLRKENYNIRLSNKFITSKKNDNNSIWNIEIQKPHLK